MVTLYFNTHSIVQIVVGFSAQACDIHQVFRRTVGRCFWSAFWTRENYISCVLYLFIIIVVGSERDVRKRLIGNVTRGSLVW